MASGVAQRSEVKQGDTLCSYRGFYYLNSDGFKNCYTNDIVSQQNAGSVFKRIKVDRPASGRAEAGQDGGS